MDGKFDAAAEVLEKEVKEIERDEQQLFEVWCPLESQFASFQTDFPAPSAWSLGFGDSSARRAGVPTPQSAEEGPRAPGPPSPPAPGAGTLNPADASKALVHERSLKI